MSITTSCPACGSKSRVAEEFLGRRVKCPHCGAKYEVPEVLTDDAETLPRPLEGYLLDVQPGFEDDPTRAVFNHVWIIGDSEAISIPFQAQVDQLTKLAPVSNATTPPDLTVPGGGQGGGTDTSTTIPDLGDLGGAPTTTTPETTTPPDTTGSGAAGGSAGGRGSGQ